MQTFLWVVAVSVLIVVTLFLLTTLELKVLTKVVLVVCDLFVGLVWFGAF